jgi:hypothetical protein
LIKEEQEYTAINNTHDAGKNFSAIGKTRYNILECYMVEIQSVANCKRIVQYFGQTFIAIEHAHVDIMLRDVPRQIEVHSKIKGKYQHENL